MATACVDPFLCRTDKCQTNCCVLSRVKDNQSDQNCTTTAGKRQHLISITVFQHTSAILHTLKMIHLRRHCIESSQQEEHFGFNEKCPQVPPALQESDEVHKKCTGCFILITLSQGSVFLPRKQEENFNSVLFKECLIPCLSH